MQILSGSGRINIILTAQRTICFAGRKNQPLPLSDGQTFDLGGVSLTAPQLSRTYPGEMVFDSEKPGICSVPMRVTVIFC